MPTRGETSTGGGTRAGHTATMIAGSCCEEQEEKEAIAREKIRTATEINEAKMMWAHRVRQDMATSLRCGTALNECDVEGCSHATCGACDEEEEEEKTTDPAASESSDIDDFDDEAESELLAKMRDARMGQIRSIQAEKASQRKDLGTHTRLREGESLSSLLEDSATYPIVLHIGLVSHESSGDENSLCFLVAEEMRRAASDFANAARLVTDLCASPMELPIWLQVSTLPAIVTLENRALSTVLPEPLLEMREPLVREAVRRWLSSERERLARKAFERRRAESDDEEDDEDNTSKSYCGRPGCKPYWHQHR